MPYLGTSSNDVRRVFKKLPMHDVFERYGETFHTAQRVLDLLPVLDIDGKVKVIIPGYDSSMPDNSQQGSVSEEVVHIDLFHQLYKHIQQVKC